MTTTYCSKSWTDINIDFETRTIKHCCKATVYQFPEVLTEEFISNSAGIKERRQQSLTNISHLDCQSCWNDYSKGNSAYRDWANRWTDDFVETNKEKIGDSDQYINYIEIKTDRICDMSCIYCSSWSSSKVSQEQNEPYEDKTKEHDYEVFKSWIKNYLLRRDLISGQILFLFLGGEPTASERFYELVDYIESVAHLTSKHIRLEICTNANSKKFLMDKIIDRMSTSKLKWGIGISNESFGVDAELIRHGLNWDRFQENSVRYMQSPATELIVMSPTVNIFNLKSFPEYIRWVHEQFRENAPMKPMTWHGNFISWPDELDVAHLPAEYTKYIDEAIATITALNSDRFYVFRDGFIDYLKSMRERIGTAYNPEYKEVALNFLLKKQKFKKTDALVNLMNNLDL
jgi:organic radical activating enzyme